jgi:methylmalonyl-CoA/ethylmalonyl-CoA epimerase
MIERCTHVGHIVKDLEGGIDLYTRILGFKPRSAGVMQIPGGKAFMVAVGNHAIELIQPTDSTHRVGQFLTQRGEGLFHISYRVDNLHDLVRSLRDQGLRVEDPREISTLPSKPKIAFIDPLSVRGAIIELVEEQD